MKRILVPGVLVLLLLGLLAGALLWQPQTPGNEHLTLAPDNTVVGGDFRLIGNTGPVALSDFRGQVVVLYFGYTWCPDICPTGLAALTAALNQLNATEQQQVQALFVSVDPERDDPQRLAQYTAYFHPRIMGLSGDLATLKSVARQYGASFNKVETGDANYPVDHTADLYLIGRDGQLATTLPHGAAPETILQSLHNLLAE